MHIVCLDLEGVLVPEIWLALAEHTGLDSFKRTTRDEPHYPTLMRYRLDILQENNLGLSDIQKIVATMHPLDGAYEFLQTLNKHAQVAILSDTFVEFATPLTAQLGNPFMLCNSLIVHQNTILDIVLRQTDGKKRAVEGFQSMGCRVSATGDSYNDISMLQTAEHAVLFRSTSKIRTQYPSIPHCTDYTRLLQYLLPRKD